MSASVVAFMQACRTPGRNVRREFWERNEEQRTAILLQNVNEHVDLGARVQMCLNDRVKGVPYGGSQFQGSPPRHQYDSVNAR
jgi:hypothetical protein